MGAGIRRFRQRIQKRLGRIEVRESLGQIDGSVFIADAGHAADDGVGERLHTVTQLGHALSSSWFEQAEKKDPFYSTF